MKKCQAEAEPLNTGKTCGKIAVAKVKTPEGWLNLCEECLFWMEDAIRMWKLKGFKVEQLNKNN